MANIGIATNKKLLELFNMMKNGSLVLAPSFQRNLVWNNSHKESFIETILLGLPSPEIYLADGEIDLETQTSKTLVIDGQQRLNTIYQYVTLDREFSIKRIPKFNELSDDEKTRFFDYMIVVRDLGRIEDEKISNIFLRINSVAYALNAIEMQNSLYEGEFITTAKDIVKTHEIFSRIELFSENKSARMQDVEYILLIMSTIEEGGYFNSNKYIEEYVKRYDDEYPNKHSILNLLTQIFNLILECDLPADSLWNGKVNFFTLIIELSRFYKNNGILPQATDLREVLISLEEKIQNSKGKDRQQDEFAQYYYYTYQGTSGKKARDVRGQLLQKSFTEELVIQKAS